MSSSPSSNNRKIRPLWHHNYSQLVAFQKVHGHCEVSFKGELRQLAKWTARQRQRNGTLSLQEKQLLNDIQFRWSCTQDKYEDAWNIRFNRLSEFKETNGHTLVPQASAASDDPELGTWVANQRRLHKQGKLKPHRKEKLERIGFEWRIKKKKLESDEPEKKQQQQQQYYSKTKFDRDWEDMFRKLKEYKQEHDGNSSVPYIYEDDQPLANWVTNQRRAYHHKYWDGDNRSMKSYRKELLESIGFVWAVNTKHNKNNNNSNKNQAVAIATTPGETKNDDNSNDNNNGAIHTGNNMQGNIITKARDIEADGDHYCRSELV
jgi:hypothetical protein